MLDNNNFGFWGGGTGGGGGGGMGTVTAVGLCMPSAFSVCCSPITTSGNICVRGAGLASQYIRGDGTLADLPAFAGGAGSQQFYFNGGVSQGTISGQQSYQMSRTANTGAAANFSIATNGLLAQFITDIGSPNQAIIPAGSWFFSAYFSASSSGGTPTVSATISKWDGTTLTAIATSTTEVITNGTSIDLYNFAASVPQTTLLTTDRIVITFNVVNDGRTITLYTQSTNLSSVTTTFTNAISSLNGLTANVQFFQTTTNCTDFSITSTGCTHCFNLPTASCTNRGALSAADYCLFYNNVICSPYIKDAQSNIRASNCDIAVSSTSFATISGGRQNQINYDTGQFIGGGCYNIITFGSYSNIVGGYQNCVQFTGGAANYSFIGGGSSNLIRAASTYGAIVNGSGSCLLNATYGAILNGNANYVANSYGVILGGQLNCVTGLYSGVANICGVTATADCTFYFCNICALGCISGVVADSAFCLDPIGTRNIDPRTGTFGYGCFIALQDNNILGGNCHFIGNFGAPTCNANTLSGNTGISCNNTISGGFCNTICNTTCTVSASSCPNADLCFNYIGGGRNNSVVNIAVDNAILGGSGNSVGGTTRGNTNSWARANSIAGGCGNTITAEVQGIGQCASFIGGGVSNTMQASYSVIAGGVTNLIQNNNVFPQTGYSFIGAGQCNQMYNSYHSSIIGGITNIITGCCSVVLGGQGNTVSANFAGAFGCGITASVNNTFYFCHLCLLGDLRNNGSVQLAGITNSVAGGNILYFNNTTKCVAFGGLTSGTAAPSGGADGDIYLQYV